MISGQDRWRDVPEASSLLPGFLVRAGFRGVRWLVDGAWNGRANAMIDRADPAAPAPLRPLKPSVQPMMLGSVGLLAGLAALFLAGAEATFVLSAISGGCFGAAILLAWRNALSGRRAAQALDRAIRMIRDDPAPVVLSGGDGTILAHNAAARTRIGETTRGHVAHAFAGFFPTPPPSWRARPPPCGPATARGNRPDAARAGPDRRHPHGGRHSVASGRYPRAAHLRGGHRPADDDRQPRDTILSANARCGSFWAGPSARWPRCFPISRSCPVGARGCVCAMRRWRSCRSSCRPMAGGARSTPCRGWPNRPPPPWRPARSRCCRWRRCISAPTGRCWHPTGRRRRFWGSARRRRAMSPRWWKGSAGPCGTGSPTPGGADADTLRSGARQTPQRRVFPADRAQPDHRCRGAVAAGRSARRDRTQEPRTAIRAKPEDAGRGRTRRRRGA
jgi:hypothetical protein